MTINSDFQFFMTRKLPNLRTFFLFPFHARLILLLPSLQSPSVSQLFIEILVNLVKVVIKDEKVTLYPKHHRRHYSSHVYERNLVKRQQVLSHYCALRSTNPLVILHILELDSRVTNNRTASIKTYTMKNSVSHDLQKRTILCC